MNSFASLHPVTLLVYFLSVTVTVMFCSHPLLLCIALVGGFACFISSGLPPRFGKSIAWSLLLFAAVTLTNPLFSHRGETVLFFLGDNPITLEALLYGAQLAVTVVAVIRWFAYLNRVLTQDKLLFLFGRISPRIALLISSSLRFVPLLRTQAQRIRTSQMTMGLYASDNLPDKIRSVIRVYSALISWCLEQAVDTGASMKARGYGLPGRRCFAPYAYRWRDIVVLLITLLTDVAVVFAQSSGQLAFEMYPTVTAAPFEGMTVVAVTAFAVLCMLPCMLEGKERLVWKYCVSKM